MDEESGWCIRLGFLVLIVVLVIAALLLYYNRIRALKQFLARIDARSQQPGNRRQPGATSVVVITVHSSPEEEAEIRELEKQLNELPSYEEVMTSAADAEEIVVKVDVETENPVPSSTATLERPPQSRTQPNLSTKIYLIYQQNGRIEAEEPPSYDHVIEVVHIW